MRGLEVQTFYRRTKKSGSGGTVTATNAVQAYINRLVIYGKTVNGNASPIAKIAVANGVNRPSSADLSGLTISRTLEDNSWEVIAKVCAAGKALDYWSVGDEKTLPLATNRTFVFKLVDTTGKYTAQAGYSAPCIFQLFSAPSFSVRGKYNYLSASALAEWRDSYAREYLNGDFLAAFPLKDLAVKVQTETGTYAAEDKLFLPTGNEVSIYSSSEKLEYWRNKQEADRILRLDFNDNPSIWWLRTITTLGTSSYQDSIGLDGGNFGFTLEGTKTDYYQVDGSTYGKCFSFLFCPGGKISNGNEIPFASTITLGGATVNVEIGDNDSLIIDRDAKKVYLSREGTEIDITLGIYADTDGLLHNVSELLDIVIKQNASINVYTDNNAAYTGNLDLYYAVYGGRRTPI